MQVFGAYPGIKISGYRLLGLEPGEGQAGDAGDDRQTRSQHQRSVRAARIAGARCDRGISGCRLEGQRDPTDHLRRHERPDEDGDQEQVPAAGHRLSACDDGSGAGCRAAGAVRRRRSLHLYDQQQRRAHPRRRDGLNSASRHVCGTARRARWSERYAGIGRHGTGYNPTTFKIDFPH